MNRNALPSVTTMITVFVCLIIGIFIGVAVAGDSATTVAPATPTVTITATPEPAVVAALPEVCLAALDDADELIDISGRMTGLVAQHLQDEGAMWLAFESIDMDGINTYVGQMNDFTAGIEGLTTEVRTNDYALNRERCKSAVS